uniref:Uncharacterized protein n=1 Tax=Geladintestivirus 1 TaxID=3233133 RepID=A0AAU8MHF2_9CAUD
MMYNQHIQRFVEIIIISEVPVEDNTIIMGCLLLLVMTILLIKTMR